MKLNDFLMSPVPQVADLAQRAIDLKAKFINKQLTESEYKELCDDLLSLEYISDQMSDLELARELWAVVSVIQNIKFFTSVLPI